MDPGQGSKLTCTLPCCAHPPIPVLLILFLAGANCCKGKARLSRGTCTPSFPPKSNSAGDSKGTDPGENWDKSGPGPLYDFTMTGGGYLAQTLPGLGIGQERQRSAVGGAGREFLRRFRVCAIRCHPIIWQVALLAPTCQRRPSTTEEHAVSVPQGYPSSGHPQSTTHPGPPVLEPSMVCGDSHSRLSALSSTPLSWQRGQLSHHHKARSR